MEKLTITVPNTQLKAEIEKALELLSALLAHDNATLTATPTAAVGKGGVGPYGVLGIIGNCCNG